MKIAIGLLLVAAAASPSMAASRSIELCGGGKRTTCIVDGDTFWLDGTKIRIAGIDAPERSKPQCASERQLAERATLRLQALLSGNDFQLAAADRDEDVYGRKLRFVMRGEQSVGGVLIAEGLARAWDGARHSWCG